MLDALRVCEQASYALRFANLRSRIVIGVQ